MYVYFLSTFEYPCVIYKTKKIILCFRGSCSNVCLFKNNCLTGYPVVAGQEEEGAVELGSLGSYGIGFEKGEEVGLIVVAPAAVSAVVVVTARIIICGLLIGLLFDQFAPLFGVCSQICIGGIYGDINRFIQTPVGAILTTFIGLFGGFIGYIIVPMTGADTTYNNGLIEIFCQAPQGACTIQNNGFAARLHIIVVFTIFLTGSAVGLGARNEEEGEREVERETEREGVGKEKRSREVVLYGAPALEGEQVGVGLEIILFGYLFAPQIGVISASINESI